MPRAAAALSPTLIAVVYTGCIALHAIFAVHGIGSRSCSVDMIAGYRSLMGKGRRNQAAS